MRRTDQTLKDGERVDIPGRMSDLQSLLLEPGIGPIVIRRLEEVGVRSVADLVRRGVEPTVQSICASMGQHAWQNRRAALVRALMQALCGPPASGTDQSGARSDR